jgi:hypothetical protein
MIQIGGVSRTRIKKGEWVTVLRQKSSSRVSVYKLLGYGGDENLASDIIEFLAPIRHWCCHRFIDLK